MDTSGFYKLMDGVLYYGPNFVKYKDFELHRDVDYNMTQPIDGWMFYPDEETARAALGIPKEETTDEQPAGDQIAP